MPSSRRAPVMKITHGPSPVPTNVWLRAGRAVDEVPGPQLALLLLDDQQARAREHEEVLLARLGVVHAGRLAGLEHRQREAELLEICGSSSGRSASTRPLLSNTQRPPKASWRSHAASPTLTTNQPGLTGARPEPTSSSRAS